MKSVCIVLKKIVTPHDGGECAVMDAFQLCGYSFAEIRYFSQANEKKFREELILLKEDCDNILLLADKTALPIVRGYLSGIFAESTQTIAFANAGIFTDKNCSLFLLSSDETETGTGFVKNAKFS